MKFSFKSSSLKKLCENKRAATKKYGPDCAKQLRGRLTEIQLVNNVSELVFGDPHPLEGDRKNQIALRLDKKTRLIFQAAKQSDRKSVINWSEVEEIIILEITDYHG